MSLNSNVVNQARTLFTLFLINRLVTFFAQLEVATIAYQMLLEFPSWLAF